MRSFLALSTVVLSLSGAAFAETSIVVQSTTSTANSGLYDHILPKFKDSTGIRVNVVAVGTGQAIKNASNCDGDVLLVHAKTAEDQFVADGFGVHRFDLMFNDFIIVGPEDDTAQIAKSADAAQALRSIAEAEALFASRGDDSGTHKKELALWGLTGVNPQAASGTWYRETGSGMGATLNVGMGMGAYVLIDRATYLSFGETGDFKVLFEGDPELFNQYGVTLVNPEACPNIDAQSGQAFVDWLLSSDGQAAIASFKPQDTQLFFPNAKD